MIFMYLVDKWCSTRCGLHGSTMHVLSTKHLSIGIGFFIIYEINILAYVAIQF